MLCFLYSGDRRPSEGPTLGTAGRRRAPKRQFERFSSNFLLLTSYQKWSISLCISGFSSIKCAPRLRNTHSGEQDRIRGLWAARAACGQFRILFFFLQKSAQRNPLDGQVVPSWSLGTFTKCFVFFTLGTGGPWRGQLWGPVAVGGLQNSKLNLFHQN